MLNRLRRLRSSAAMRNMLRETVVRPANLVYPIFVREGLRGAEPIPSMPGQYRLGLDRLSAISKELDHCGVQSILVFGLPSAKDDSASSATSRGGIVPQAVAELKSATPGLVVITDVCVCAYTPSGHCGLVIEGEVDNDSTLPVLSAMALAHARAGADVVAPSAMMDGQVAAIREALDGENLSAVAVMGYSAKFASAYYGPFRDAADSAPSFGDRSGYQHDPANIRHAERELLEDEREGADILMVKPGLAYLDVLLRARQLTRLPLAAYMVSGEYSMIKAASERGWLDERRIVLESLTAFRRAGADLIITYHAKEAAQWLNES